MPRLMIWRSDSPAHLSSNWGSQQYPRLTATIAELISNAWDADAEHVWVSIPFGETWTSSAEIVVLDDGNGMLHDETRDRYLVVGEKRREKRGRKSDVKGRLVHGRKGIGKLASFGAARYLDCVSVRDGVRTAFRLDYDEIRKRGPGETCKVSALPDIPNLRDPRTGEVLEHGTLIRLRQLKARRRTPREQFMRSMSRRFAVHSAEMEIWISGQQLTRFDIETEFRFPGDGTPPGIEATGDDWVVEDVNGQEVHWWFGFTQDPIDEDELRGVSIFANGKLMQRPFFFERGASTAQAGMVYMVGEVRADWIDSGTAIEDDLSQTNRDLLQLEDQRLSALVGWGQRRVGWALRRWATLRREKTLRRSGE